MSTAGTQTGGRSVLPAALLLMLAVAAASLQGWLARADQQLFDALMVSFRRDPPNDIVIVAVDEQSLARIGRWPWRRAIHATLVNRLGGDGVAAIGLDLLLAEPDPTDPASDASLAAALAACGRVVLPLVPAGPLPGPDAMVRPVAQFAGAAAALGIASALSDGDGLSRAVALLPRHFAVEVLRLARPGTLPADLPLRYLVPFAGPAGHFLTVSYADVLDGTVPRGFFTGKIVLVGTTAAGLRGGYATPADTQLHAMSGVELHANVIDGLRRHIVLREAAPWGVALSGSALIGLLCLAMPRLSARAALAACLAAAASAIVGSWLALRLGLLWLPPAATALGALIVFPVWSWRRLDAAQRYLESELERLQHDGAIPPRPASAPPHDDAIDRAIAALRSASAAERRAWAVIEQALEHLPSGVVVADSDGTVRLANRQALASLTAGTPRPSGLADWLEHLGAAALSEQAQGDAAARLEVHARSGRHLHLALARLPAAVGTGARVLAIADVTALRGAQRSREETLRFLSHDLRSPLSSLISIAQLLQDPDEPPSPSFSLARIEALGRKALNLADDFLRLSRAEALDAAAFRPVDLVATARRAIDEVTPIARARGVVIGLAHQGDAAGHVIRGDPDLLERACINLLGNAVRHSPGGGEVALRLANAAGETWLEIADRGEGIAPDVLPRLFTAYTRSASASQEGTGLGLVIVKAVVERHGGHIDVDTAVGCGTTFRLRFPDAGPGAAAAAAG